MCFKNKMIAAALCAIVAGIGIFGIRSNTANATTTGASSTGYATLGIEQLQKIVENLIQQIQRLRQMIAELKPLETCGNGKCRFGETAANCPTDCGATNCTAKKPTLPACTKDHEYRPQYDENGCISSFLCGELINKPVCRNSVCETGETAASCPADCGENSDTCTQNQYKTAFVLLVKDKAEATAKKFAVLNRWKTLFSSAWTQATRNLSTMDTSANVSVIVTDKKNVSPEIIKEFYKDHEDIYDFITFYFSSAVEENYQSHLPIQNNISGIGIRIFNDSDHYGTNRLLGFNQMLRVTGEENQEDDYIQINGLLHETGHQWASYVGDNFTGLKNGKLEIIQQNIHFYPGLSSPNAAGDPMGSHHWKKNSDGTYTDDTTVALNQQLPIKYHPFVLYFMGLLPKNEYSVKYEIYNAGISPNNNWETANYYKSVSVNDIIAVSEPRKCQETCGNGKCRFGETAASCPTDCKTAGCIAIWQPCTPATTLNSSGTTVLTNEELTAQIAAAQAQLQNTSNSDQIGILQSQLQALLNQKSTMQQCCNGLTCRIGNNGTSGICVEQILNAVCGNGTCETGETAASCAADCGEAVACTKEGESRYLSFGKLNDCCAGLIPVEYIGSSSGTAPSAFIMKTCAKCGDNVCGKGETSANCAKDCPSASCYSQGQGVAGFTASPKLSCCAGLTPSPRAVAYTIGSVSVTEGFVCINCGNGKCETSENIINCPKDCLAGSNVDPIGYFDVATCKSLSGWVCDKNDPLLPVTVHFYADGKAGSGGKLIGSAVATTVREKAVGDICGGNVSHGFVFETPASVRDGKSHLIYAYGINIPTGNNPLLQTNGKTITCVAGSTSDVRIGSSSTTGWSTISKDTY